ncbi:NAD(P)H-dependent oxidoreductase [Pseudomonas sp. 21LCFQ02]|uniref:NAD(P)H-dependent oxidoreductase n=1 Tax=Pseudomonas sp. 21LCFQ02 TaxID=2957505 RepID=UPI00209B3AA0|nr:NAD(P)H-dependent oxidoreductase [Pseudomonas sp. 21LCFQ02]MCO8168417.1 NAD(P)H-dependent oxidoreductase [Pseudomonas sp. 21LCFQ02]
MAEARSGATPLEGNGKRILMIYGTPKAGGLCHALGDAYALGARGEGHVVRSLKLGEMAFDPILRGGYEQGQPLEADLLDAQRLIHWAEHLVLVYPVWWSGLPALLSGFFDRVLIPGFAFRLHGREDPDNQLLKGRSAELLISLDTPPRYFRWIFGRWIFGAPPHRQITRTILGSCGIRTTRLTEFAPVRSASEAQRQQWVRQAEQLGRG